MASGFYDLSATSLQGREVPMEAYKGKVVLVVNTASKCGFTPQYEGLETLYRRHKDEGLVVLGFPCNQFGNQEPGGKEEIEEGCILGSRIKWNFTKFLIDASGKPVKRFAPITKPEKLEPYIAKLLAKTQS